MSFVKAITVHGSHAATAATIIVSAAGAIPVAAGRACATDAVWVWSLSVATLYGVVIISSTTLATPGDVWLHSTRWLLLTVALSVLAMFTVGTVIVPISAARQLAHAVAQLLHDTSDALDRCVRALHCVYVLGGGGRRGARLA
jgi:hypothetical protein